MPTYLGAAQSGDKLYMCHQPSAQRTLRGWLTKLFTEDSKLVARNNHPEVVRMGHQLILCLVDMVHGLLARHPSTLHRDTKPENFCIIDEGEPLCLDLGTAKLCTDSSVWEVVCWHGKVPGPRSWKSIFSPLGCVFSGRSICRNMLLDVQAQLGDQLRCGYEKWDVQGQKSTAEALKLLEGIRISA
ncbi:hypothetical protein BDK51DRAFT_42945 [Blyttiomyces helicus]|uniref:Protein kinase domain-containing protein n=1 Tax=Blyttiomyces helicus TaxID=388810 RepID=A0A4P9WPM9_9FUNG|nr:hypothetical protein BDK51DRAFT_42945 [Blyttiomyces helicus]|eukprot:RKO94482.1 hypothetical protein BDK51DRAFT_42945 [Blyttiomyces helicus]